MYKLIIVDDHKHVVEGMMRFVKWNELGVEIIDTAINGEEGIRKIREHKPDIVITDISMPITDGLEMIRILKEDGLNPKFIIQTGYGEFEYAREAVKYGVIEYILKPVLPKDIVAAMEKVVRICDEEYRKKEHERRIQQRLTESMPILQERFIEELFEGSITNEAEIAERGSFLGIDLASDCYRVLSMQIDNYESFLTQFKEMDRQFLMFSLTSLFSETFGAENMSMNIKGRNVYYLLKNSGFRLDSSDAEKLLSVLTEIISKSVNIYEISISVGVGEPAESVLKISDSYHQALESLKYKLYFGNGKVIFYRDIVHTQLVSPVLQFYDREKLTDGLKMRLPSLVNECLDNMFSTIRNNGYIRRDYLKMIINEFIGTSIFTLFQIGERFHGEYNDAKSIWEKIDSLETMEDIEEWVRSLFGQILDLAGQKQNQRSMRVVEQIIEFININYSKDISLNELSKHIYLTPNYLSNIFSNHMGKGFNEYLCEFRMQKAKELLLSGKFKVYEVCEMVGYKSQDYFRKMFKEHTGFSPSDFTK